MTWCYNCLTIGQKKQLCCIFQVLEMFSSEGDLHLELPTGEKEAPRSLWVGIPLHT